MRAYEFLIENELSQSDWDNVVDLYVSGINTASIGKKYGINGQIIGDYLHQLPNFEKLQQQFDAANEARRAEEGPFVGPILRKYYHGTTLERAKKILKTGLKVSYTKDRGENCLGYIFLGDTVGMAAAFAPGGIYGPKTGVGVILEINPPAHLAKKIRWDLGEFLRCPVDIPAKFIKVLKYTNRNTIE